MTLSQYRARFERACRACGQLGHGSIYCVFETINNAHKCRGSIGRDNGRLLLPGPWDTRRKVLYFESIKFACPRIGQDDMSVMEFLRCK